MRTPTADESSNMRVAQTTALQIIAELNQCVAALGMCNIAGFSLKVATLCYSDFGHF